VALTAVYTVTQTILAQNVAARYVAIYLGRMRDDGLDALGLVGQMQRTLNAQHAQVEILAASVRTPVEVEQVAELGVSAARCRLPCCSNYRNRHERWQRLRRSTKPSSRYDEEAAMPDTEIIRTVLGDIKPSELGRTNVHEHLLMRSPLLRGDELGDVERSAAEAIEMRNAGMDALVELTPIGQRNSMEE